MTWTPKNASCPASSYAAEFGLAEALAIEIPERAEGGDKRSKTSGGFPPVIDLLEEALAAIVAAHNEARALTKSKWRIAAIIWTDCASAQGARTDKNLSPRGERLNFKEYAKPRNRLLGAAVTFR